MGRRSGFYGILSAVARDTARAQRQHEIAARRSAREAERAQRAQGRYSSVPAKEEKQRYLENRINEANELNLLLAERIKDVEQVLETTLRVDDTINFDSLRVPEKHKSFYLPPELSKTIPIPDAENFKVVAPKGFSKLMPGAKERFMKQEEEARLKYQAAVDDYHMRIKEREHHIAACKAQYEQEKEQYLKEISNKNEEVNELEKAYIAGDPTAICVYCTMVLERSEYPEQFPQEFRVAYVPESKQLVLEYELPTAVIIPTIEEYRYVKSKDKIEQKERKPSDIKERYQDLVASIALRTLHELFEADQGGHLDAIVFNGFVSTVDRATGKDIKPCLISCRATKAQLSEINLARVDKSICLRNLGAQVSSRPNEMQAVRPIIEFDMVDKRFVEESDILADLEDSPNLMDLNPFQFENLVVNLFQQMGLDSKLTRSSRDGGVDAVAFDPRPVLGGKVVIQAKRYTNTVGVAAVRDLYGTMMNEGANKGILVTTSGYGPDAYEFSKDKPIELIDGSGLLYLLQQVGTKARIIFAQEGGIIK